MSSEPPNPPPPVPLTDPTPLLTSSPLEESHPRSREPDSSILGPTTDGRAPSAQEDDDAPSGSGTSDTRAADPSAASESRSTGSDQSMDADVPSTSGKAVRAGSGGSSVGSSSSSERRYTLSVVQQPKRSAEFGTNVLSRLPLGPPLIVRLDVTDAEGNTVDIEPTLPFLFSHISLVPSSTSTESTVDLVVDPTTGTALRMLYGTLVSSPHQLSLIPGASSRGVYFVFPDVSVKLRGTYRLRVGLMRIAGPPGDPVNPPEHSTLATIVTEDFEITSFTDYVAPAVTAMTGSLSDQGVQMFLPRSI